MQKVKNHSGCQSLTSNTWGVLTRADMRVHAWSIIGREQSNTASAETLHQRVLSIEGRLGDCVVLRCNKK